MSRRINSPSRLIFVQCLAGLALWGMLGGPAAAAAGSDEAALRGNVAWQVALDGVGFSPGVIDGRIGPKTHLATREFQRVHRLPQTGELDSATAKALKTQPAKVFVRYPIIAADLEEVGPSPRSWLERSRLKRLGHASLQDVVAEHFHCSRQLLADLNPGLSWVSLKPGHKVVVPAVIDRPDWPKAAELRVDLAEKVVRVIGRERQLIALFHCSVAAKKSKLPSSDARVVTVVRDPWYTFDPEKWPEVKENITGKLAIPPGPRNPVGRCWIGLSLSGYGMHGTPNPEMIGKTGSHGCFRLANWDAQRLARMVEVGTPVRFTNRPGG